MKSFLLILTFIFFPIYSVFSQNLFVGGGLPLHNKANSNPQISNENISIGITPTFGYKINEIVDIGFTSIYQYEKKTSDFILNSSVFGIGLFSRCKFIEIEKMSFLFRLGINYLNGTYERLIHENITYYPSNSVARETEKTNIQSFNINICPVYQNRLNNNLLLYTSIGNISYSHAWSDTDFKSNNSGFVFSTDVSFGFYLLL